MTNLKEMRFMRKNWSIILGIFLLIYVIYINFISGTKIAFSVPIVFLGIILIFFNFIKGKIMRNKAMVKGLSILKRLLVILLICFISIEIVIVAFPKHNDKKDDYAIVLGAGLANGETPSLILEDRLNAAIKYSKENPDSYLVLSGGQGEDEKLPESLAMKKYLIDNGINENKILIEDKSRDTNENFKYSKKVIENNSRKNIKDVSVKIITTDFHALRSSILAKKNGYGYFDNYSSDTVWYLIPVTYTREAFALIKSILFDK
jgi:uncharacterized SAM-binding protein YcdF (DUF218 family)